MSSLPPTTVYRIALLQSGLGDNGNNIEGLINQLKLSCSLFASNSFEIDMSHYNPLTEDFCNDNGSHSNTYEQDFINKINNIIAEAHEEYTKTILVRTRLNTVFGVGNNYNRCFYDSIENQSKKLIKIIDSIKTHSSIRLSLIGHSQGGLVNMEAAIVRPLKIYKMISISTPYSPVKVGSNVLFFESLVNLIGSSLIDGYESNPEYKNYLVQSVNKLTSSSYFNDLKSRWNSLGYNPSLTVITGSSGLLKDLKYYAPLGCSMITHCPFDGLVCLSEQRSISNASFVDLIKHNALCFHSREFITTPPNDSCYSIVGIGQVGCSNGPNCNLPSVNLMLTGFQSLLNAAYDYFLGTDVESAEYFANHPITIAIDEGLSQISFTGSQEYQAIYDLAYDQYNHLHILKNQETIGTIIGLLFS